ncbi:MAG: thioredoxin family protein [Fimbriimonas sp.]|nr:thioredoxin family protein [Fimbriimonas sp.]
MTAAAKVGIIFCLGVAVVAVMSNKAGQGGDDQVGRRSATGNRISVAKVPRILDLGSDKCIPCKMMQPVLADLRRAYESRLRVDFIDVWKHPQEAETYKVETIPTQIFFDATGKERFRHVGFYSTAEIISKMKELGFAL